MQVPSPSARVGAARWLPPVVSVVLASAVLAATLVRIDGFETLTIVPPDTWVECLIFVTAAATLIARWFPYPAIVVATVCDAVPHWLPIGGGGYHLSLMITVYMLVAHRPTRRALPVAGTVFVVQVGLMAWVRDWHWHSFFVATTVLTVALPIALGLASRSRTLATEALRERARAAEATREADARKLVAEDRLRTARDLHDSVAHQIAVMNLNAGVASQSLRDRPDLAESALVTVREAGRAVIASISDLLTSLREGNWDDAEQHHDLDDLAALTDGFRSLSPAMNVDVQASDGVAAVSPVLYAVVREALTNAYKHGRPDGAISVRIHLGAETAEAEVVNERAERGSTGTPGFGLRGMRERVESAGGRLTVSTTPDGAFRVWAQLPGSGRTR